MSDNATHMATHSHITAMQSHTQSHRAIHSDIEQYWAIGQPHGAGNGLSLGTGGGHWIPCIINALWWARYNNEDFLWCLHKCIVTLSALILHTFSLFFLPLS